MTARSAYLAAAAAAVAVLVLVPFGVTMASAIGPLATTSLSSAVRRFPALLELTTAIAWVVCVYLPLGWLAERAAAVRSAPLATSVFVLAFGAGALGFYRSEAWAARLLFSGQYALLVLLAFLLFFFLTTWLQRETEPGRAVPL
jgi:hypothetical protein